MAKKEGKRGTVKHEKGIGIELTPTRHGEVTCCMVGTAPFVCNRMSFKVKCGLLLPARKKNQAQKESTLKHDPVGEFRDSPLTIKDPNAPTLLAVSGAGIHKCMSSAAMDVGGKKTEVGRLTWVEAEQVGLYGIPKLFMAVVRQQGMNRAPDIRTRAIVEQWACEVAIRFVRPKLGAQAVFNLLASGGQFIGIGDGRPEKGALAYGRFRLCNADDEEFRHIVKYGGRAAQIDAMDNPVCYDDESQELLTWFHEESARRDLAPEGGVGSWNGTGEDDGEGVDA